MNDRPNQLVPATQSNSVLQELAPLHDVPLRISIDVGRIRLPLREFMRLGPGFVLDLKKPAGEPFEVAINGRPVARGEVIMVEQSSGVRIVEVLKPSGGA